MRTCKKCTAAALATSDLCWACREDELSALKCDRRTGGPKIFNHDLRDYRDLRKPGLPHDNQGSHPIAKPPSVRYAHLFDFTKGGARRRKDL